MQKSFLGTLLTASILGAALTIGCTTAPTASKVPTAGTILKADDAFWNDFYPRAKGMKWVYSTKIGSASADWTQEITDVTGEVATIKSTVGSMSSTTATASVKMTMSPDMTVKVEGTEDVTVPAGTYKGAAKISVTSESAPSTNWFVSGVGLVKAISTSKNSDGTSVTTTLELKSFTK